LNGSPDTFKPLTYAQATKWEQITANTQKEDHSSCILTLLFEIQDSLQQSTKRHSLHVHSILVLPVTWRRDAFPK
jgi:NADH:ubiquinone oxidoreductase subunit E